MSMSNLGEIGQLVAKILRFFQFFKVAGTTILDFQICKISLADSGWEAQTHHRAKCGQNRSSCCGDIAIFPVFQNGHRRHLQFLEIAKFYWLLGRRESRDVSVPNFVKIGQSVAKILRFFDFSIWRPQPPWTVEFTKFY